MSGDPAIEEWLPPGVALRVPAAASPDRISTGQPHPERANGHAHPSVNLNEIDFDGLIALGVSVGQAARFVSQRERRGGITALSELDGYHGLAPTTRALLRLRGRV